MTELIDWDQLEGMPPGTPGWHTLAVRAKGKTRRPAERIFVAVEQNPRGGVCSVFLAAQFPESGPEVITPFETEIRVTENGVATYLLVGATKSESISAPTS